MKLTLKKLEAYNPCEEGLEWYMNQKLTDVSDICLALLEDSKFDWANWLLSRCLSKRDSIRYAVFAAKQALEIFEDKFPDDKRPRKAICAAEKYLKSPTDKNKNAAAYAANAAYAVYAVNAAYAAANAAYAAANAAYAAACAVSVANAAVLQTKIIKYGLKLLKGTKR